MLRLGPLAALLIAGCSPGRLVLTAPELPAAVVAVAVGLGPGGAESWSALELLDGAGPTLTSLPSRPNGSDAVTLLGYTAADLAGLDLRDQVEISSERLNRAAPGEPRLPNASYLAAGSGTDRVVVRSAIDAAQPRLTAPWLPDCPSPTGAQTSLAVSASCDEVPCFAAVESQRCSLTLSSPEPCVAPLMKLELRADGQPLEATVKNFDSCTTASTAGALLSLSCRGQGSVRCAISAFPRQGPAPVEVEVFPLAPELPRRGTEASVPWEGYLAGLALLSDRVLVGSFGSEGQPAPTCRNTVGAWYSVDRATPSVVRTTTAPPCLSAMTAIGDRVFAAYGASSLSFGEFDRQGRLLRHLEISPRTTGLPSADDVATDGRTLYFLTRWPEHTIIFHLDVETFTVRHQTILESRRAQSMTLFEDVLAVADDDLDALDLVDLGTDLTTVVAYRPDILLSPHKNPGRVLHHRASGRFINAVVQPDAGLWSVRGGQLLGVGRYYERYGEPTALLEWGPDPTKVLVALLLDRSDTAALALYDPAAGQFLPGSTRVSGLGQIAALLTDRDGTMWGIAPWTASLLRVRPRP